LAGGVGQHEAKVNMEDVAERVNKDVCIMAVFDLEDVAEERIPCEGADEGFAGSFELRGVHGAEGSDVISSKRVNLWVSFS